MVVLVCDDMIVPCPAPLSVEPRAVASCHVAVSTFPQPPLPATCTHYKQYMVSTQAAALLRRTVCAAETLHRYLV